MELNNTQNLFGLKHFVFDGDSSEREMFCIPGICLNYEMFTKTYDPSGVSWVDFFVSKGFRVHVMDWQDFKPEKDKHFGSSLSKAISDIINKEGKEVVLVTHSTSGAFGWKIAEFNNLVKKVIALAPAPPGNIQNVFQAQEDPIVFKSGEYTYHIDMKSGFVPDELWVREKLVSHAPCFPQDKINDLYGICKSCDSRAILERFNYNGNQLKIDEKIMSGRNDLSIKIVTGDFDPPHPYDVDKKTSDYFKNLGIKSEFLWLPDVGLKGHGHMFTMEIGNLSIFERILKSIRPELSSGAQDMGENTHGAFSGKGDSLAVIKTYKESIDVFAKALKEKVSALGVSCSQSSLADLGSFSGEFLSNLLENLKKEDIAFNKVYGVEVTERALSENAFTQEKIVANLTNIPIESKTFDVSVARYVLQWNSLKNQEKIIQEIVRTTKSFAIIQHPAVELVGQQKFHELFKGELIPALKRAESYYSTQKEVEDVFKINNINFELYNKENIENVSDVFIERYHLNAKEAQTLKEFLSKEDKWDRVTWIIYP